MKLLHTPFGYFPDPVGGTEVYVQALVNHLSAIGVESVVAAPGEKEEGYMQAGIKVYRFSGTSGPCDIRMLYGGGDAVAAKRFAGVLDRESPDIVHLHARSPAVSNHLISEVQKRRIPIVFTYHTPTVSCLRGTLLRWGQSICDGALDTQRCSACVLQSKGLGEILSATLSRTPVGVGRTLGSIGGVRRFWLGLRMTELTDQFIRETRRFFDEVDRIIVLSTWTVELMKTLGIPKKKVTLIRHGLCQRAEEPTRASIHFERPLRLVFMGRLDESKGLDLVLKALRKLPMLEVEMDVFGIRQGESTYASTLVACSRKDRRIKFHEPVASDHVIELLTSYDALIVPSKWLETGPLVVLEALEAGIPVVGTNLGGIKEWVEDGVNGILFEPNLDACTETLAGLSKERLFKLREGIRKPRSFHMVAEEVYSVYRDIVAV